MPPSQDKYLYDYLKCIANPGDKGTVQQNKPIEEASDSRKPNADEMAATDRELAQSKQQSYAAESTVENDLEGRGRASLKLNIGPHVGVATST